MKRKAANISPTDIRASKGSGEIKGLRKMRRNTSRRSQNGGKVDVNAGVIRAGVEQMKCSSRESHKGLVNEVVGEATPRKPQNQNTQNAKTQERKREQEKKKGCNVFCENLKVPRV